jgi:cation:H+ antiporter
MTLSFVYLFIGFVLLIAGGEFLVRSSVGLSLKLNLSRMIIGLTVVSFATSAPELLVSVQAALNGSSAIALGNVIGSNIANIGLVLGLTAIIAPLSIDQDFLRFNWPWMMVFSLILYGMLWFHQDINFWEGIVLLSLLVVFLFLLIKKARKKTASVQIDEVLSESHWWKVIVFLILGGALLWGGSELLVSGATEIATQFSIPEGVIAVSMVAIGTSVPELAASIIAALKKEKAISLGNLIGSNIFNIGSVLGITAIIQPIKVEEEDMGLLSNDIFWMLGFATVLLPLTFILERYEIGRFKGLFILGAYLAFLYLIFETL